MRQKYQRCLGRTHFTDNHFTSPADKRFTERVIPTNKRFADDHHKGNLRLELGLCKEIRVKIRV